MAQDAIDHALKTGKLGVQARPCATSHLKLVRSHRAACCLVIPLQWHHDAGPLPRLKRLDANDAFMRHSLMQGGDQYHPVRSAHPQLPSLGSHSHLVPLSRAQVGAHGYTTALFTEVAQNYVVPHRPGQIDTRVARHLAGDGRRQEP